MSDPIFKTLGISLKLIVGYLPHKNLNLSKHKIDHYQLLGGWRGDAYMHVCSYYTLVGPSAMHGFI